MGCDSIGGTCEVVKDLGCVYVGATKVFSGVLRNAQSGDGIPIVGKTMSVDFSHNGHSAVRKQVTFQDTQEARAGYWQITLSVNDTDKFKPGSSYDVEFQLEDKRHSTVVRDVLGEGTIKAIRRKHDD